MHSICHCKKYYCQRNHMFKKHLPKSYKNRTNKIQDIIYLLEKNKDLENSIQ